MFGSGAYMVTDSFDGRTWDNARKATRKDAEKVLRAWVRDLRSMGYRRENGNFNHPGVVKSVTMVRNGQRRVVAVVKD